MDLGDRIYRLRMEKGLSQEDLAEALEVSRQSVSKWETNASVPELDKLVKLSQLFGISLDALVLNKPQPQAPEPEVIYVERAVSHSPKKTVGAVLLGFAAVVWLLVSLFGDMIAGLVLAIPFVACGLICLFVPVNTGLLCAWAVYLFVELYLLIATGISPSYVFVWQIYAADHMLQLLTAWVLLAVFVLLTVITVIRFSKGSHGNPKSDLIAAGIAWAVYFFGWFINIPPYEGNLYDINSIMLYRMVTSVTNWFRNIVLVVAVLFTARTVLHLLHKRKSK